MAKTEPDDNALIRLRNLQEATFIFEVRATPVRVTMPDGGTRLKRVASTESLFLGRASDTVEFMRKNRVVHNIRAPSPVQDVTLADWRRLEPASARFALDLARTGQIQIETDLDPEVLQPVDVQVSA